MIYLKQKSTTQSMKIPIAATKFLLEGGNVKLVIDGEDIAFTHMKIHANYVEGDVKVELCGGDHEYTLYSGNIIVAAGLIHIHSDSKIIAYGK